MTFKVVRSGDAAALAVPGSVTFTTVDGTGSNGAIGGSDYIAKSGTLNFAAGQTEQTITVDLRKDLAHENSETFLVALTGSNSGVLVDDTGAIQTTLAHGDGDDPRQRPASDDLDQQSVGDRRQPGRPRRDRPHLRRLPERSRPDPGCQSDLHDRGWHRRERGDFHAQRHAPRGLHRDRADHTHDSDRLPPRRRSSSM